jgi:hypothetical protein
MEPMNIFSQIFGIFRQQGLVSAIKENRSLVGFSISAILVSILGGALYGFAMGIGLGTDTSFKDALKVSLIVVLGLLFSIPVFWLAYRLLGREERPAQVAAVPLTFMATVAIILAVTSPVVFMLSILTGYSSEAVYVHIVIVDVAMLIGLYLAGTLVYQSFPDLRRLVVPNVIGFVMMGVILVVTLSFLAPYLRPSPTFSLGTDRLKDGLGVGVADKVNRSLLAATDADHIQYRFQATNDNGDLLRDYTVTRVGDDYLIQVHLHAVPGEDYVHEKRIWLLEGEYTTDFQGGKVSQARPEALASYLDTALPKEAFALPPDFASANWRAFEGEGRFTATGASQSMAQATVTMESESGKLSSLIVASAERGPHAERRVLNISAADLDREALQASLNQAIVLGSVDQSDASMNSFVQGETFFVVRYPRTWQAGAWDDRQRQVQFTTSCGHPEGCPSLKVNVYDLEVGKSTRHYAYDLAKSLGLQPQYRQISASTIEAKGQTIGVVEYLFDQTVKGEITTTQHIEYIFEGKESRYHLDFSAPQAHFESYRELFARMATLFTYLEASF